MTEGEGITQEGKGLFSIGCCGDVTGTCQLMQRMDW